MEIDVEKGMSNCTFVFVFSLVLFFVLYNFFDCKDIPQNFTGYIIIYCILALLLIFLQSLLAAILLFLSLLTYKPIYTNGNGPFPFMKDRKHKRKS